MPRWGEGVLFNSVSSTNDMVYTLCLIPPRALWNLEGMARILRVFHSKAQIRAFHLQVCQIPIWGRLWT